MDILIRANRRLVRPTAAALAVAVFVAVVAFPAPSSAGGGTVTLEGVVRRAGGELLKGARVAIAETDENLFTSLATTNGDGVFAVEVPTGTYRLTVFPPPSNGPERLLVQSTFGVRALADVHVALEVREGVHTQVSVADRNGDPVEGARFELFSPAGEVVGSTLSDASGWTAFAASPELRLLVTPPVTSDLVAQWLTFDELEVDQSGVAKVILLETLPAPREIGEDLYLLHEGRAAGPKITIVFVAEGFTDGDEPFTDANGNGVCDHEPFLDMNGDGQFSAGDRWVDANGNGRRDVEPFDDLNGDGVCNRGERELFLRRAAEHLRMVFGLPVYREWSEKIDAVGLFVASDQAGSSFPTLPSPISRDTAFRSEFQSTNFIFRMDHVAAQQLVSDRVPDHALAVAVTYDIFSVGRESAGKVVFLFGPPQDRLSLVFGHELGHAIGKLADEYFDYLAPPYTRDEPDYPNVTLMSALQTLKWSRFVKPGTPIPTEDASVGIGAFEGGLYRRRGLARPAFNCLMRAYAPLCAVCADATSHRFASLAGLATGPVPAIVATPATAVEGVIRVPFVVDDFSAIASARLVVDGVPTGAASTEVPFAPLWDAGAAIPGQHDVAVEITSTDGTTSRSPAQKVRTARRRVSEPEFTSARIEGGALVLVGPSDVAVAGAVALVDGDRFPLAPASDGTVRVPRRARGSLSGKKFSKSLKRSTTRVVVVRNPDGGATSIQL